MKRSEQVKRLTDLESKVWWREGDINEMRAIAENLQTTVRRLQVEIAVLRNQPLPPPTAPIPPPPDSPHVFYGAQGTPL